MSVGGAQRSGIAAYDRVTGALLDWAPVIDQTSVRDAITDIEILGNHLIIAGGFRSVNNEPKGGIAALDITTGGVEDWAPGLNAPITAMRATENAVYVAGRFSLVNGQFHHYLAAFQVGNDAPLPWKVEWPEFYQVSTPGINAIEIHDNRMYVLGSFKFNDPARPGEMEQVGAVAIDMNNAALLPWRAEQLRSARSVAFGEETAFIVGEFDTGNETTKPIAEVRLDTGKQTAWNMSFNYTDPSFMNKAYLEGVAIQGKNVILSGLFDTINGIKQHDLAFLDRQTAEVVPIDTQVYGWGHHFIFDGDQLGMAGRLGGTDDKIAVGLAYINLAASSGPAVTPLSRQFTLYGSIHPNGKPSTATFQITKTPGDYSNPLVYPAVEGTLDGGSLQRVSVSFNNFKPDLYYYRVVRTSANGVAYGKEQVFDARLKAFLPIAWRNAVR